MTLALPPLGLGTGGREQLSGESGEAIVAEALDAGYRHVDTAQSYGNEETVGAGIGAAEVPREEVVVATKVARSNLAPADVRRTVRESADRLDVETIDLLYVHFPTETYVPEDTLPAFDEQVDDGLVRHIAVSNFSPEQVEEARAIADNPIVANQVELHPFCQQRDLVRQAREYDMYLVAHTPLAQGRVFDVPEITAIARKHGVSEAAVSLAWMADKDNVVSIPKTSSSAHLRENLTAPDLDLDSKDVETIDSLDGSETVWSWTPDDGGWTIG